MTILDLFNWKEGVGEVLQVRVTPKASANRLKMDYAADGATLLRVYVTAAPENGKANEAVIRLLSKELGLPKSAFTITHGLTDRNKVIRISR